MMTILHRRQPTGRGTPMPLAVQIWSVLLAAYLLSALQVPVHAIPAFSRKYHMPCEQCHSMVPKLNPFGYAFYRAGFRITGPNKPMTLSNSADILIDATAAHVNPGHSDTITNDFAALRFSGTLSSEVTANVIYEASTRRGVSSDFDEVWAQYNTAAKGTFWSFRVGQMPVLDGYNLMGTHSVSLTDPQFTGPFGALSGDNGNLSLTGLERGLQAGYTSGKFFTRFSLLYGVDAAGDPNNEPRFNDYLLQAEYLLDKDGSAIQAFGYVGRTPIDGSGFADNLQRGGIFGTWGHTLKPGTHGIPAMRMELSGGLIWGEDQVSAAGDRQDSVGTVIEADLYLHNRTALFARYDGVRLGNAAGTSTTDAGTVGISHRFTKFFKAELELREQRAPYNASILGGFGFYF
ncbi:MAG: hypothetical protein JWL77_1310 [Chthonomonadaceae bacterium]|nr:hypothetical protein [Chthonomonadaceae bacterium]